MYLYVIRCGTKHGPVKIGIAQNVERRLAQLQTASPFTLKICRKIKAKSRKHAEHMEKWLHHRFRRKHIRGEWFTNINYGKLDTNCQLAYEGCEHPLATHNPCADQSYRNSIKHPQERVDKSVERYSETVWEVRNAESSED